LLALRRAIPCWLEDADNGLTDYFRPLLHGLWGDLVALDDRMAELDKQIKKIADSKQTADYLLVSNSYLEVLKYAKTSSYLVLSWPCQSDLLTRRLRYRAS
jgi:hypothetical protein